MKLKLTSRIRRNPLLGQWLEKLTPTSSLIWPLFVYNGSRPRVAISGFPDVFRYSVAAAAKQACEFYSRGGRAVLLFGLPRKKDSLGSESDSSESAVAQAIRAIKKQCPKLIVITDVCLCAYTDHGHCGILKKGSGVIDQAKTLSALGRIAVCHAKAGADIVAPSSMTNGRVRAIRKALDSASFTDTAILDYSVKFHSAFYGPFRSAADSAPSFGDRSAYQIEPTDQKRALAEIHRSQKEGADILMIKPALAYLDIIAKAKEKFSLPLAAYNVSGEYALLKTIQKNDKKLGDKMISEVISAIRRAGADLVISYHARDLNLNGAKLCRKRFL